MDTKEAFKNAPEDARGTYLRGGDAQVLTSARGSQCLHRVIHEMSPASRTAVIPPSRRRSRNTGGLHGIHDCPG